MQDANYAYRGVGRHALALLRHAPADLRLVGLTDPALPDLRPEAREAVAAVCGNAYAAADATACFVMLSPMTHDPLFAARLLSNPAILRAAIVHDFIPRHQPNRYLPSQAERLRYALSLYWLARCDLFLPNSRNSANELRALLDVVESRVAVTGCPIDPIFVRETAAEGNAAPRHIFVAGGGDPRKNPEVVIRAHARSPAMQVGAGIPLVIAGLYAEAEAETFRAIAIEAGGRADLIEVPGRVEDTGLLALYRRALAIVCPSLDEGFSIPVVEAMAAGVPCLASDIPAHAELVTDSDCRFPPESDGALRSKLERVVADAGWRAAILARQAEVWPRFRAEVVAKRFWDAVHSRLGATAPSVMHHRRPRVALLTPLQPDRSGVADYSAATCVELGRLVDLHVFTETEQPERPRNVASIRPLDELPHVYAGFDRVISVVGNSHFHLRIFNMMRRYGSACIAHDARMLGFYYGLLGRERALAVASKELGRPVAGAELEAWLGDEGKLEALFLGEIAESAAPTIVHSAVTARMFFQRYGTKPTYVPFSIYHPWTAEELTKPRRAAARARLGLASGDVLIATFGFVHNTKAPEECVWALEVLRGWGIPASLHFVGALPDHAWAPGLVPLIARLGLVPYVRLVEDYVSEQTYRDYLAGADLAIQLRTYGLGGLSGGLLDCAAAGLPTVTTESLGAAVGVPGYVRCIPDAISPLLLAESLADLRDAGPASERPEAARAAFSEQRSFANYARALCDALALGGRTKVAR